MSISKLESCIELDVMCACLMREINAHNGAVLSGNVNLISSMGLIVEAIDNFHGKLQVVYQAEQGKTS